MIYPTTLFAMNKIAAICLMALSATTAFGQIDIGMEFVEIGDPGNPPDPITGNTVGTVTNAYKIGKYEVTVSQYVQFLNAVDPLGANLQGLYGTGMGISFNPAGYYGQKYAAETGKQNYPVTGMVYDSVLRFVNWLHGGDTETGAYTMANYSPSRNPQARYWIPSRNEWHKAAYYHGPNSELLPIYGTDYSLYPMGGFTANASTPPGTTNSANFGNAVGQLVSAGSYSQAASHYGTFDQGGNAEEWFERQNQYPSWLGGNYLDAEGALRSSNNPNVATSGGSSQRGFRVAGLADAQQPAIIPTLEIVNAVELKWASQVGVKYQVQVSDDLLSWTDTGSLINGTGSELSVLQQIRSNRKFFRVLIIP